MELIIKINERKSFMHIRRSKTYRMMGVTSPMIHHVSDSPCRITKFLVNLTTITIFPTPPFLFNPLSLLASIHQTLPSDPNLIFHSSHLTDPWNYGTNLIHFVSLGSAKKNSLSFSSPNFLFDTFSRIKFSSSSSTASLRYCKSTS